MSDLTIGQILKGLKPSQLWAVLAALVGLAIGAFTIGYNLQLSTAELRAEKAGTKLAEFRGLQTKEKFLALYLRYLIAKDRLATEESDENQQAVGDAREAYFKYVMGLLKRGDESADDIDLRGLTLGKGGGGDATVKFGYDGSVWQLPRELGLATAD